MGVLIEGARIFLVPADEPRIEGFAESASEFFPKGYRSSLTFVRDASGTVVRVVLHIRYRDIPLEKAR